MSEPVGARGEATKSRLSSSSLGWLAGDDAGRLSRRLDVTLCTRSSIAVSVGSHRANFLRQRQARHGYLGGAGELHAGIVELLANEILNEVLEGSCREMDTIVMSLAAGSVRESVS